jgi:hypothetical protein
MMESNMATMIVVPNSNVDNRTEVQFADATTRPTAITCLAGGKEMLRVGPEGFWVRGVQVPQDDQEAQAVYNAFKQWMAWTSLQERR